MLPSGPVPAASDSRPATSVRTQAPDWPPRDSPLLWARQELRSLGLRAAAPRSSPPGSSQLALATQPGGGAATLPQAAAGPGALPALARRGMATMSKLEFTELEEMLRERGTSLQGLQEAVAQLGDRLRREHHITVVRLVAQLWPSLDSASRPRRPRQHRSLLNGTPAPEAFSLRAADSVGAPNRGPAGGPGAERDAAKELAEGSSLAVLSGRVDVGLTVQLMEAWLPLPRPSAKLLMRLAAVLVPEADAWVRSIYPGTRGPKPGTLHRRRLCMERVQSIGTLYDSGGDPVYDEEKPAQYGRKKYGLLHAATIADVAIILRVLAKWDMVLPPFLGVITTITERRAGYEAPEALAAAAAAFRLAKLHDPRVAAALLGSALAALRQHASRGGRGHGRAVAATTAAAAAPPRLLAELLRLCGVSKHYERATYGAAADALLTHGVGGLNLHEVSYIMAAFSAVGHEHPMLFDVLASHTIRLLAGDEEAMAAAEGSRGGGYSAAGSADGSTDGLDTPTTLSRQLLSCSRLVQGFGLMRVGGPGLYGDLAREAVRELDRLSEMERAAGFRGACANPRQLAGALGSLLQGFAAAGQAAGLPPELEARVRRWSPLVVSFMQAADLATFAASLAQLRLRDGPTLAQLDRSAQWLLLLEHDAESPLRRPRHYRDDVFGYSYEAPPPDPGERHGQGAAAAAVWLPAFLEAMCWGLDYPCRRTLGELLDPVSTAAAGGGGAEDGGRGGAWRRRNAAGAQLPLLQRLIQVDVDAGADAGLEPRRLCCLMGVLACAGVLTHEGIVRYVVRTLARSLSALLPGQRQTGSSSSRGDGPTGDGYIGIGPGGGGAGDGAAAVAALDDVAAASFFRGFIVLLDAGLAPVFEEEMPQQLAAPLLARGESAWHAARLGTAVPQTLTASAAAVPTLRPRLGPLGGGLGGGAVGGESSRRRAGPGVAAAPAALPALLQYLRLPVFGACETPDGLFRVECGVALSGAMVGVEVLPDSAFALEDGGDDTGTCPRSAAAARRLGGVRKTGAGSSFGSPSTHSVDGRGKHALHEQQRGQRQRLGQSRRGLVARYRLVGDAAFRARSLRERGWHLVAFRASEWAEAEAAGAEACLDLLTEAIAKWMSEEGDDDGAARVSDGQG